MMMMTRILCGFDDNGCRVIVEIRNAGILVAGK
jgi:hypothetical protein